MRRSSMVSHTDDLRPRTEAATSWTRNDEDEERAQKCTGPKIA